MKTPAEKYLNDPYYHNIVNYLESLIVSAQFTPSELRQACILACINYETKQVRKCLRIEEREVNDSIEDALLKIREWVEVP